MRLPVDGFSRFFISISSIPGVRIFMFNNNHKVLIVQINIFKNSTRFCFICHILLGVKFLSFVSLKNKSFILFYFEPPCFSIPPAGNIQRQLRVAASKFTNHCTKITAHHLSLITQIQKVSNSFCIMIFIHTLYLYTHLLLL